MYVRPWPKSTDFIPGISNVKDATTALSGFNPVTGEEVDTATRVMAGIFAIPIIGNAAKYIGKGGRRVWEIVNKIDDYGLLEQLENKVDDLWAWGKSKLDNSGPAVTSTPTSAQVASGRTIPKSPTHAERHWRKSDQMHRAGKNVSELDESLGGIYRRGPAAGEPRMGHTAKQHRASRTDEQLRTRATTANIAAATKLADDATHLRVVNISKKVATTHVTGHPNGLITLPNGSIRIQGRSGTTPTVGERLSLSGYDFSPLVTGEGFFGRRAPAGHAPGTPTGPLTRATIVLEMTGTDTAGNPVYKVVTAHPSL